ncbi:hypothetical protein DVA85_17605 [Acinetobacter sp. RIT592]|nr:hypothetical protein DVA85_17605 [Acinetobacter sp. RIT592]
MNYKDNYNAFRIRCSMLILGKLNPITEKQTFIDILLLFQLSLYPLPYDHIFQNNLHSYNPLSTLLISSSPFHHYYFVIYSIHFLIEHIVLYQLQNYLVYSLNFL